MFLTSTSMKTVVVHLPRNVKQGIVIVLDILMCLFSTWLAFSLRLDTLHFPEGHQWRVYEVTPLLLMPVLTRFGLYRSVFRYTGIAAIVTIAKAITIYGALLFSFLMWLSLPGIPRSVGLLQPLLLFSMVGASRAFARLWLSQADSERKFQRISRMLIYGAGAVGAQIADALQQRGQFTIIGFLDDSAELRHKLINGLTVYGADEVGKVIEMFAVTDVLLALPTTTRARRNEILEDLRRYHVHVSSLPDLNDLASGKIRMSDIHELDIVDLLGRDPVPPNPALISRNLTDKVVLVTGAGGSIGSELCRQILTARPSSLLLLDHNEYSLYQIHRDLMEEAVRLSLNVELIPLLGSVKDFARLSQICRTWHPKTVYHAAAYKHVPLVEHNPAEGIRNNVFGTLNAARAAMECGADDFVLVSTDKAVRPTNIMGATKRLAEMILQALTTAAPPVFASALTGSGERRQLTRFSMVRFGNVLDSSGSVVPLFRRQIKAGGPITLTDPEVTRYFMTIPEAAQLVIQAGAMTEGGDVFVLDMGEPVKILDLACKMVQLSGLSVRDEQCPDGDIAIKITGLRPGEKLYEELLIGANAKPTLHPRIMKAHEDFIIWDVLRETLANMQDAVDKNDVVGMLSILEHVVTGFKPASQIVDWVDAALSSDDEHLIPEFANKI